MTTDKNYIVDITVMWLTAKELMQFSASSDLYEKEPKLLQKMDDSKARLVKVH